MIRAMLGMLAGIGAYTFMRTGETVASKRSGVLNSFLQQVRSRTTRCSRRRYASIRSSAI